MTRYSSQTRVYYLEDTPFESGGEGAIFSVSGDIGLVAKIYSESNRTRERLRKLICMLTLKPQATSSGVEYGWPTDILYDSTGDFSGFVMPRVHANMRLIDILAASNHPGTDWKVRVAIAHNLATAVNCAHDAGFIIGDLNARNILINRKNSDISLIDNDSYHIVDRASSSVYRCEVGVSELLAPELQKKDLRSSPKPLHNIYTDRFSLAILIFSLLMNGVHPFTCKLPNVKSSSIGVLDMVEAIYNCKTPFFNNSGAFDLPVYAPHLNSLPDEIVKLFRLAFIDGYNYPAQRPSPGEWRNALASLYHSIRQCSKNSSHQYYINSPVCPWCIVEQGVKKYIMYSAAQNTSAGSPYTATPSQRYLPQIPTNSPIPANPVSAQPTEKGRFVLISLGCMVLSLIMIAIVYAVYCVTIGWIALLIYGIVSVICWAIYVFTLSPRLAKARGKYGFENYLYAELSAIIGPALIAAALATVLQLLCPAVIVVGIILSLKRN